SWQSCNNDNPKQQHEFSSILNAEIAYTSNISVCSGDLTPTKPQHQASTASETRLFNDLFISYNKRVRAARSYDDTTHVSLGLSVRTFAQLDERHRYMETISSLHMSWNDYRLQWDRSEYGWIDQVKVPARELWRPDIAPLTSMDEDTHMNEIDAIVYATGDVHWSPLLRLRSPCSVNLRGFPFDQSNCSIELASSLYHGGHVNITYYGKKESTLSIDGLYSNPIWQSVNYSSQIIHRKYYCCNESYPVMKFNFLFRRKSQHFFPSMVIPALLLGALVPLSFLLPPDCKERVTAEMIIIGCLLYLLNKLYEVFPMAQGEMPTLAKYYVVTLVLDVLALVGSTIVLNLHNRGAGRAKIPDFMKGIFLDGLGWIACLNGDSHFPLSDRDSISLHERHRTTAATFSQDQRTPDQQNLKEENSSNLENQLEGLGESLNAVSLRFAEKDHREEVLNEWQQVALVIDRLLFLFFPLAFIVSSAYFLT
ncbi:neuronal acetylcholine receptor subunit alpha-9-like precursor, partial [Elysia marginata]